MSEGAVKEADREIVENFSEGNDRPADGAENNTSVLNEAEDDDEDDEDDDGDNQNNDVADSSEEDDDEDDEEAIQKVREGFIVDDEDEEDGVSESTKRRRHKKKKRAHEAHPEEDVDALDEDDLDLLLENSGVAPRPKAKAAESRYKRLKRAAVADEDDDAESTEAARRGLTDMFSDVEEDEDDDEDDGKTRPRSRINEEFDDFIEEDEFSDEEPKGSRQRQIPTAPPIEMTEGERENLAELDDIFGDGRDYEWALEEEDEANEYDDEQYQKPTELADVFEQSELKERMLTAEDNEVRVTDVPERFQVLRKGIEKYELDEDEFEAEVEWVSAQMVRFRTKLMGSAIDFPQEFRKSVRTVLEFVSKENYEVPFIWNHRRDYLLHTYSDYDNVLKVQKLLYEDDLWRIVHLDIDFHHLNDTKIALQQTFKSLDQFDGLYDEQIAEVQMAVELQDLSDYLAFAYSGQLGPDASAKKRHSKYAIYDKIRSDAVFEVVRSVGIKSSEFAENVASKSRAFATVDPPVAPETQVAPYVGADKLFDSADQALAGVKHFYAEGIFTNPKFRKEIRVNYERYSKVDVVLTEKGKVKMDENGPYGDFRYLINHPTATFVERPDLFLRMLEAESLGYIVIKVSFDLQSFGDHIFEKYLKSDYSSDVAEAWNGFRKDALDIALRKVAPVVSLNVIEEIRRDCEDKLYYEIRKKFVRKLDQAPYKPAGYAKGTIPKVLALSSGHGNRQDAVIAASLTAEGDVEQTFKFDENVKHDSFVASLTKFVLKTKPDVIAVSGYGVNTKTVLFETVRKIVQQSNLTANDDDDGLDFGTDDNQPPLLEVVWVNNETCRLYENSKRAKAEFPDRSQLARFVIAAARYVQQPLLEYIALKADLASLAIHRHQSLVSTAKLQDALETSIVDIVNQVGVDINEAIRDEYLALALPYVAGLGPRKASGMIQNIQSKGSTLVSRSDLITQQITARYVFVNCASFLRIPYNNGADADPLDATRIHPQDYDLAIKMAADTLELDEEDIDPEERSNVINQLVNEGVEKLNDLVLEDYGNELEERFKVKKRSTLQAIKEELQANYEELRRSFHLLTVYEVFHMLTGESRDSFHENVVLPITLRVVRDNFLIGATQFNVECRVDAKFIRDYSTPAQLHNPGQTVQACILHVDYEAFKCDASLLKRDIENFIHEPKFEKIQGLWDFEAESRDLAIERAKENAERRSARALAHPLFHNFNSRQAEDFLAPKMVGECVIRPSSIGENHYAVTLKIADLLYQHIVLVQHLSAANTTFYTIDKDRFDDLDEVINRYVEGLTEKIAAMTTHDKFRKAPLDEVKDWLQKYSAAQARSSYTFCYNRKTPGWFYLLFKIGPQAPINTWHVRALPDGYELSGEIYPDMTSLCNGFKQMMMNRTAKNRAAAAARPAMPAYDVGYHA